MLDALKNRLQNGPDLRVRSTLPPSTNHWITRASVPVSDVFYLSAGNFTGRGTALCNKQKQKENIQEAPLSLFSLPTKMLPE